MWFTHVHCVSLHLKRVIHELQSLYLSYVSMFSIIEASRAPGDEDGPAMTYVKTAKEAVLAAQAGVFKRPIRSFRNGN